MKIWKSLLLGGLVAGLLTVSAFAADFTHCAKTLSEIDVFRGSDGSFELDRAPTRVEAAIMTVRMLGAEQEALDSYANHKSSHPFTDVEEWASPYIAYLYGHGLTTGDTATSFGTDNCTAQQYATFMLRALGYSDKNGDFTYANALAFAQEVGVVDFINCDPANFLRDHVAAMTLTTLATDVKGQDIPLFDKLVASGAIKSGSKAGAFLSNYRDFMEASAAASSQSNFTADADIDCDVTIAVAGATPVPIMSMEGDMSIALDSLAPMNMAIMADLTMTADPVTAASLGMEAEQKMSMDMYLANNMLYQNILGQKMKTPLNLDQLTAQVTTMPTMNASPIALFTAISKKSAGGEDTYTMTMDMDCLMSLMAKMAGPQPVDLEDILMEVTVENGKMSEMEADMAMTIVQDTMTIHMDLDMSADYSAWGTTKVTLPKDLNTYTLLEVPTTLVG